MEGPHRDQRIEEAHQQLRPEAEDKHQRDRRGEGDDFPRAQIAEAGNAGTLRAMEDALPEGEYALMLGAQNMAVFPFTISAASHDSSNSAQAANVLKCLAGAYLERHSRLHRPVGETNFFERQITESRRNLQAAELQLMEFTRDEGVVSAAQQRDIALQRLGEAEVNSRANQVEIAATGQRIRMLQSKLQSLPERATTVIRNSDNPELLGKIKAKLLELELQRTQLLTKYESSYRLVQEVDQQIAETRNLIAQEELAPLRDQSTDLDPNHAWAKGELVKAEVELSVLQARAVADKQLLAAYQTEASTLGDRAIKQDELLSNLKAVEEEYLLYVGKREEARIGDALDEQRDRGDLGLERSVRVPRVECRFARGSTTALSSATSAATASRGVGYLGIRLSWVAFDLEDHLFRVYLFDLRRIDHLYLVLRKSRWKRDKRGCQYHYDSSVHDEFLLKSIPGYGRFTV